MAYLGQGGEDGHGLSEGRSRQDLIAKKQRAGRVSCVCVLLVYVSCMRCLWKSNHGYLGGAVDSRHSPAG